MPDRPVLQPTAAHPISIEPTPGRVRVSINGHLVADTAAALGLRESTYPVVQYVPLSDVVPDVLRRSDTHTYCPYKGEASYYTVATADGSTADDVIWTYEQPYAAVAEIAGHLAFYPDRAQISVDDS